MSDVAAEAAGYIEKSPFALLITVGEDNTPFARYIGPFVNDGLDIYFITRAASRKAKHIDGNPFVIIDFQIPSQTMEEFKGVAIAGKAARVPEGNERTEILKKLGRKSPGFRNYVSSDGFKAWAMYKIAAHSLQWTDLAKSTKTVKEEI